MQTTYVDRSDSVMKTYIQEDNVLLCALETSTDACEPFSLKGEILKAKVVRVKDGDTINVCFSLHGAPIRKWCVRMLGYDSCEIHTTDATEKVHGLATTLLLEEKILDKIVDIRFDQSDKYGRWLATVELNGENINEYMLANSPSVLYHGKTKTKDFRYDCESPAYKKHLAQAALIMEQCSRRKKNKITK